MTSPPPHREFPAPFLFPLPRDRKRLRPSPSPFSDHAAPPEVAAPTSGFPPNRPIRAHAARDVTAHAGTMEARERRRPRGRGMGGEGRREWKKTRGKRRKTGKTPRKTAPGTAGKAEGKEISERKGKNRAVPLRKTRSEREIATVPPPRGGRFALPRPSSAPPPLPPRRYRTGCRDSPTSWAALGAPPRPALP